MKTALHLFALIFCTFVINAQSSVNIKINHFLDGNEFENEVNSTNDLGNDFMIDRLQYYLSGFSITHDGGQITKVEDLYVLVSLLESAAPTLIELGEYDIESLESVSFYLGIDSETNHEDPSILHPSNPLSPKFPSMHWGWASGYRFIALEGKSGPNVDQELQFHCIGDEFYKLMEYEVEMDDKAAYTVEIDAEYKNLLEGIDISGGLILHGNLDEIKTLASNLTEKVFSKSVVTNTVDSELVNSFEIYPNPVLDGRLNIRMEINTTNNLLLVHDALGRIIYSGVQKPSTQIELSNAGLYLLSVTDSKGKVLATRKIVVQ